MEEPEEPKLSNANDEKILSLENTSVEKNKTKTNSGSSVKNDDDEGTISEGSISEHIVSLSGSIEHDRSLQEIEIFNNTNETSGAEERTLTPQIQNSMETSAHASSVHEESTQTKEKTDSLNQNVDIELNRMSEKTEDNNSNKPLLKVQNLPSEANQPSETKSRNSSESKNSKSILEELLCASEMGSNITKDESFNLFANVDLSDKSLINLSSLSDKNGNDLTRHNIEQEMRHLQEILAVKDCTINALTQELDSLRELSNQTANTSSSGVSATEYRQLQEECQDKISEYNRSIMYKNQLIQQLSESLDQSVSERKELINQIEIFKSEMRELQEKLAETTKMVEKHQCSENTETAQTNKDSMKKLDEINSDTVGALEKEIIHLKEKMKQDKDEYVNQVSHLRELLENIKCGSTELAELKNELDQKHAKEVEELRLYFEKKCADLEKNYSEEVFSQQSRKLSDSISDLDLSNDFLSNNNQPGPGGDHGNVPHCDTKINYKKFKNNLETLLQKFSSYSTDDLKEKDIQNFENDARSELNSLIKYSQQFEIKAIEKQYVDEITNLRCQLEEAKKDHGHLSICSAIQETGTSGDFEITDVIESYERRLQEQVNLARIDIINELVAQIERFASDGTETEECPVELLELREKFGSKYKNEIQDLNEKHQKEIKQLKDQLKTEKKHRRSNDDSSDSYSRTSSSELLQERDNLKRQVMSLHNLLSELLTYFTQAEDALNTTLIDELLKHNGLDQPSLTAINDEEINFEMSASITNTTTNSIKILDASGITNGTKVRLTPNFQEILNKVGQQTEKHDKDESVDQDISVDLVKHELSTCLEKLRQDANTILALTNNLPKMYRHGSDGEQNEDDQVGLLSKQISLEIEQKERLKQELEDVSNLMENQRIMYETRTDELVDRINILDAELDAAKCKIAGLIETGHKEVISEGYGDGGEGMLNEIVDAETLLLNLQESARTMLTQSRTTADAQALQIIEEFCRVGEKMRENSKRERGELMQQIEAADKKYKTTQKFLEEQAFEREQERDDAQKQIKNLYDMLKERDKDRANWEIILNETKQLEHQLADLTHQLDEEHTKYLAVEKERDETSEKVRVLREIIRELENQNDFQKNRIDELVSNVEKLKCIIQQQHSSLDEFKSLTDGGNLSDIQLLRRHIEELEEVIQKLRIESELAGSEGATRQIKLQLFELEVNLDKKIKELELLPFTGAGTGTGSSGGGGGNSCSSPSEDMSVRDVVRPQTSTSSAMDECEVPLQQLARLKEKLIRHSRAEEAALKRIRDLEMEVFTLKNVKNELEESQNEKECMKRQIQDNLIVISDLQIRLDHQRIKAEHIEKQANTSFESKIYHLQQQLSDLEEKLKIKDKTIQHQDQIIKETQKRCVDLENELATEKDDEIIIELQKELETIRQENRQMKDRLSNDNQILPNLVESIIADKNTDIEQLRAKLSDIEKQLYTYTSLDLDNNDLKLLANLKHSGGSIEQLISILDLSQQQSDCVRRVDSSLKNDDLFSGSELKGGIPYKFIRDVTPSLPDENGGSSEPEISSIERIVPRNLQYSMGIALGKQNSTEKSLERRVHFEEAADENLSKEIDILKEEIALKNKTIEENEIKLKVLNELEEKISTLQKKLDETEQVLNKVTESFEKESGEAKEREQQLGVELAEKKMYLDKIQQENETLKQDSLRKDEMCTSLTREKNTLEKEIAKLKKKSWDDYDSVVKEKNALIDKLETRISSLKKSVDHSKGELNSAKNKYEKNLKQKDIEIGKLQKDIKNKIVSLDNANLEIRNLKETLEYKETLISNYQELQQTNEKKIKEFDEMKHALNDKKQDFEILKSDMKYYENKMTECGEKVKFAENDLKQRIEYYENIIKEKDLIITRMNDEHADVHKNLQTINKHLQTTGNIFDLSSRLKKEQKLNADLFEEIHSLKAKLMHYEVATNLVNVDEITAPLRKELECGAEIDSSILNAVHNKSLNSLSDNQDVEIYRNSLEKLKLKNKNLLDFQAKLEKDMNSVEEARNILQQKLNNVEDILSNERLGFKQMSLEYDKIIDQMNIKFQISLKRQSDMEIALHQENQRKKTLELELESLKRNISGSSESTKYQSLPPPPGYSQIRLEDLQKQLEIEKNEKTQLNEQLKYLYEANTALENNIKYTKEILRLEMERTKTYEEKLRIKNEKEKKLRDEFLKKKMELEGKCKELEAKNIELDDLERQTALLENQKSNLLDTLKAQSLLIPSLESSVPPTLSNLVKELNDKNNENAEKLLCMERIEKENRQLRDEIKRLKNINLPPSDLLSRNDYLLAKSLKLESIQRALIWQKLYLLKSLKNPAKCGILLDVPAANNGMKPRQRFRSVVYTLIAIERMKFLVKRWHSGKRNLEKINARHYQKSSHQRMLAQDVDGGSVANFQIGQPITGQHYLPNLSELSKSQSILLPPSSKSNHSVLSQSNPNVSARGSNNPWNRQIPTGRDFRDVRNGSDISHPQEMPPAMKTPILLAQLEDKLGVPFVRKNA